MTYAALPDMRMPYDNDGTVVMQGNNNPVYGSNLTYPSGSDLIAMNGFTGIRTGRGASAPSSDYTLTTWCFFPETREVTGVWYGVANGAIGTPVLKGSSDSTNGLDGTWETASWTPVSPEPATQSDQWRSGIRTVSFTGAKRVARLDVPGVGGAGGPPVMSIIHWYGKKAAGQTPDDILFLNGNAAYAEFAAPADFGDRPLGTTSTWTWKVQNASATKTANTINLQCNDSDFTISTDGVTWVATINIASLAAGASSGVMYIRNTTPNPGGALGPRFARIVCTVASYT